MLQSQKDALTDTPVTLNGQPAAISGRLSLFPIVRTLKPQTERGQHYAAEFTWQAVARIVAAGGDFRI